MEAAAMVSSNAEMDYEAAITTISKKLISEQVMGTTTTVKPLTDKQSAQDAAFEMTGHNKDQKLKILSDRLSGQATIVSMKQSKEQCGVLHEQNGHPKRKMFEWEDNVEAWEKSVNWDDEIYKNPCLGRMLGSCPRSHNVSIGSNMIGNSFANYTVNIHVTQPNDCGNSQPGLAEKENV